MWRKGENKLINSLWSPSESTRNLKSPDLWSISPKIDLVPKGQQKIWMIWRTWWMKAPWYRYDMPHQICLSALLLPASFKKNLVLASILSIFRVVVALKDIFGAAIVVAISASLLPCSWDHSNSLLSFWYRGDFWAFWPQIRSFQIPRWLWWTS